MSNLTQTKHFIQDLPVSTRITVPKLKKLLLSIKMIRIKKKILGKEISI